MPASASVTEMLLRSVQESLMMFLSTHDDRQSVDVSVAVYVFSCLYGYGFLRRG